MDDENAGVVAFINSTLVKILAVQNALDNMEVSDLYHALELIKYHLIIGPPDDGFLRIILKYFDPDDEIIRGNVIKRLYKVQGIEKVGVDSFLSWVRSEIERIDGPPPAVAVGGRRRQRKSQRKTRKSSKSRY